MSGVFSVTSFRQGAVQKAKTKKPSSTFVCLVKKYKKTAAEGVPNAAVWCYSVVDMKQKTVTHFTPIQLKLPVDLERIIKISDPVYAFNEVVSHKVNCSGFMRSCQDCTNA